MRIPVFRAALWMETLSISDSVMVTTNILFSRFDRINEEDSSFIMLVPETRVWDKAYDEAQSYFNYGSVNQADSLQRLYAHQALIRDLVYNRNIGCSHMADSVYSIAYNKYDEERRHVYYKPLAAGGIFLPISCEIRWLVVMELFIICTNGRSTPRIYIFIL